MTTEDRIIAEKDGSLTVNVNGGSVISSPPHIVDGGAIAVNNKPVAIRYDFDGYGYQYIDSGSGSDWQTRVKGEPLYTHPAKTLTDEEIWKLWQQHLDDEIPVFARAILKKASEK
jgi:hypothetical protein